MKKSISVKISKNLVHIIWSLDIDFFAQELLFNKIVVLGIEIVTSI